VLSAKRVECGRLAPFAILGAALLAIYLTGAAVYLPHLFSSYASRYGVIGAVLAMISALFGMMVVLVASAAVGREIWSDRRRNTSRRTSTGSSGVSHGRKNPAGAPSLVTRITSSERNISLARSRNSLTLTTLMWAPEWSQPKS